MSANNVSYIICLHSYITDNLPSIKLQFYMGKSQFFQGVPFLVTLDVHSVEGLAWNVALATENEVTPKGRSGVGEHLVALREQALFRMRSHTKY